VELGDGARTGAGSVVTKDVPAGMLALGVPARLRKPRAQAETTAAAVPEPAADADTGSPAVEETAERSHR
jgi:serine acetyltransferase